MAELQLAYPPFVKLLTTLAATLPAPNTIYPLGVLYNSVNPAAGSADYVYGALLSYLPAAPASGDTVSVTNVGVVTSVVSGNGNLIGATATVDLLPALSSWFIWGGYSWGAVSGVGCTSVILPTAHSFAAIQVSGPSETPYAIPAPTVVITALGTTPCGKTVRKITTTTYSLRTVAGATIYKRVLAALAVTGIVPGTPAVASVEHTILSTISAVDAKYQGDVYCNSVYSALLPAAIGGYTRSAIYDGYIFGGSANYYYAYLSGGIANGAYVTACTDSIITASLYYLDSQEVWTYDVV